MKTKFSGLDRLIILKFLPEETEGTMLTQTLVKEVIEILKIPSSEFADFGLYEKSDGTMDWDPELINTEKEFDLSIHQVELLKQAVAKLDKEKKIRQHNLSTCIKVQNI